MKSWKVIINHLGNIIEVRIEAKSYSDAYIKAEESYFGCLVKSIAEIRSLKKPKNYETYRK